MSLTGRWIYYNMHLKCVLRFKSAAPQRFFYLIFLKFWKCFCVFSNYKTRLLILTTLSLLIFSFWICIVFLKSTIIIYSLWKSQNTNTQGIIHKRHLLIFMIFDPPPSPCLPKYALKISPKFHFWIPPPSHSGLITFMDGS